MIFHNTAPHPISFHIGPIKWDVPVGGEVDVPPHLTYAVKMRGLPLKAGTNGGERVEGTVPGAPPKARRLPGVMDGLEPGTMAEGEAEDASAAADEAPAVTAAAERLRAQGVLPKGKGR